MASRDIATNLETTADRISKLDCWADVFDSTKFILPKDSEHDITGLTKQLVGCTEDEAHSLRTGLDLRYSPIPMFSSEGKGEARDEDTWDSINMFDFSAKRPLVYPRRCGKTMGTAMYAAAYLVSNPNCEIILLKDSEHDIKLATEQDIKLVMEQVVDRTEDEVRSALEKHGGDVVEAVLELSPESLADAVQALKFSED